MPLTMKEKQAVTKQLAVEYKRAGKKVKGRILDTVIELTGYNRSYASRPACSRQGTTRARQTQGIGKRTAG